MSKGILIISVLAIVAVGVSWAPAVRAYSLMDGVSGACTGSGDCSFCDALRVVYNIGKIVFTSMVGVALILILWNATGLILNFGIAEKVAAAKKALFNTLLAILIIMLSWTLVDAIGWVFLGANLSPFREAHTSKTSRWADYKWYEGPTCE